MVIQANVPLPSNSGVRQGQSTFIYGKAILKNRETSFVQNKVVVANNLSGVLYNRLHIPSGCC